MKNRVAYKKCAFMKRSTSKCEKNIHLTSRRAMSKHDYIALYFGVLYFLRIRSVQALQDIDWTDRLMLNENEEHVNFDRSAEFLNFLKFPLGPYP